MFVSIMMKKWLLLKNIPILRLDCKNDILFITKTGQIYPIHDQNSWKTIPFGAAHTYIAQMRQYPPPQTGLFAKSFFPDGIHDCKLKINKHPWVGHLNLFIACRVKIFNITSIMAFKVLLVLLAISILLTSGTERSKDVFVRGRRLCLCRLPSQASEVSRDISFYVPVGK